ncbi:methyltransferase domain-containing protein [Candidatus Chloroploca sp. M-50]|uniref:Methyltransferase domain-containing protein n=1 Tax=Candidatus Chloroploca mongolica TaxID=2528176 RepID=A0ABS4DGC1_9CHLR|nr:class I SAM-dependent methyltransferase [Candidatus Chloroploca mongolica]MBP1468489.1 methyltransferase domain-containing protein [Candidatus Chloroploca mongolica]
MQSYDPFARYYDADFREYRDDVALYHEFARRTGGPLLELMCGTGRVLVPLAEAGYTITGVDSSAAMLAIAREQLAEAELTAQTTLIQGDVRDVHVPTNHFSLAFIAINSFMHLERVGDQLACLNTMRKALTRRGLLILDLFSPDPTEIIREDNRLVLDRAYHLDGRYVQKFVAIDSDYASQVSRVTYLYDETDPQGQVTRRTMQFTMRWLYRFELEHLLARAGFVVRHIYGSYELDEYATGSPRLIAVASPAREP